MTRWTKLAAVVPLVLMTGAWTAAIASDTPSPRPQAAVGMPEVPTTAFEQPASNPSPLVQPLGVGPKTSSTAVLTTLDATGIPAPTVAAYKRSESVLAESDTTCSLPWTLVAAIGRVESNHGRYGGNRVGADGVSTPGIYGIALDGTNDTARITDTDQGAFDNDSTFDRAVGPMQFIPGTWRSVAVDGDNDGSKNPQDINDAALATGVYLCAGAGDLSTPAGAKAAVLRYNHSSSYAALVLSIATKYAAGDFDSPDLPSSTVPADDSPEPQEPTGDDTVTAAKKPADLAVKPQPKKATRTERPKPSVAAKPVDANNGDKGMTGDENVAAEEKAAKKAAEEKAAEEKAAKKAAAKKAAKEQAAKEQAAKEQAAKEQAAKEAAEEAKRCYVNDGSNKAVVKEGGDATNPADGCLRPCVAAELAAGAPKPQTSCRNPETNEVVPAGEPAKP